MVTFSWTSAFWIFNWVAQQTYSRYDYMIKDVRALQVSLDERLQANVDKMDETLAKIDGKNRETAVNMFCKEQAKMVVSEWKVLGEKLLMKYLDGNLHPEENGKFMKTKDGAPANPGHPGYNEEYYRIIKEKTGDKLKMRTL